MAMPLTPLFEGNPINVLRADDGQLWFNGVELACLFGYPDAEESVHEHCRSDGISLATAGNPTLLIDMENVYRLIFHSSTQQAQRFATWLGQYLLPQLCGMHTLPKHSQLRTQGRDLQVLDWQGGWWLSMRDAVNLFGSQQDRQMLDWPVRQHKRPGDPAGPC